MVALVAVNSATWAASCRTPIALIQKNEDDIEQACADGDHRRFMELADVKNIKKWACG